MSCYMCGIFLILLLVFNPAFCKNSCQAIKFKSNPDLTYLWCNKNLPDDVLSSSDYGDIYPITNAGELSVHGSHRGVKIDTIKEGSFENASSVKSLQLSVPIQFLDKYSLAGFDNVNKLSVQVQTFRKCAFSPVGKTLVELTLNSYYEFNYTALIDKDAFTGMDKLETVVLHELDKIKTLETKEKNVCDHFFCAVPTLKQMDMGVPYTKADNCKLSVDGFPYNANLTAYVEQEGKPSLSCLITTHKCHLKDNSFKQKWCGKVEVCHDNFFQVKTSGPSSGWMYYVIPLLILLLLIVVGGIAYYVYTQNKSGAVPVPTEDPAA